MSLPAYTIVIATYERAVELRDALADLCVHEHAPEKIVVVDSSKGTDTRDLCAEYAGRLPLLYERAEAPSAAVQRNQGARHVSTPLIAFLDDDVRLPRETFGQLCRVFAEDAEEKVGGVSARINGLQHKAPSLVTRLYYRLQAGYSHPTWGGRIIGPALNFLPTYTESEGELIPADWLNAGCTVFRTELFNRERFPRFPGYSYGEDVHLSARIGKTHRLFFHKSACYDHIDAPSPFKRDLASLVRGRLRNQRIIADEVLGTPPGRLEWQLFLHRLFVTYSIVRRPHPGGWRELRGLWSSSRAGSAPRRDAIPAPAPLVGKSAPFFSVIVPVFNRPELVQRTLETIFAQTFTDFEVLVVDDGSTDNTLEVLAGYGEKIRVLRQTNSGPAVARNLGIRHASGKYIAILDSDDLWFPWTLATYAEAIRAHGEPAFLSGQPRIFVNENELTAGTTSLLRVEVFADYLASSDRWRWFSASSFVLRADAVRAVGGFSDQWINCDDADLALRLGTAAGFVAIQEPVTFGYREHAGSLKTKLDVSFRSFSQVLDDEACGGYPGAEARCTERRTIISRHIRPFTFECLQRGALALGWQLYRRMFGWHLRELRLPYLLGWPMMALGSMIFGNKSSTQ